MGSLLFLQFWHELTKLFARKRTHLGFAAFLFVEAGVLFLLNRPGPKKAFRYLIEQNGYAFESYFSGLTLGLMMVGWTVVLLGGLYLALVSGDVVSKEVEEGTMRMMLCRPVSRTRIILLKYCACVVYTMVLAIFLGLSALATGLLYKGWGGLFVVDPIAHIFALHEPVPGFCRYLCALPMLGCCLVTIASLGFMLSCFNMKPAAATIVTLTVVFFDFIFRNLPYFESLKPYFITTHISTWLQLFIHHIPWRDIGMHLAYLAALDASFVIIGVVAFSQRDFKS